jgi:hypothetical protein
MAQAGQKIQLPDVEETIAFNAVDHILKGDPVLKRVVKHYNAWTGDASDLMAPTPALCPFLQIAPRPSGSGWEAEGLHRMPISVGFTVAVNGSDARQLMNLWGFIRRALWPADPARMAAVRTLVATAGITKPTMMMAGFGVQVQKDGARLLIGQGSLNLLLLISTP